MSDLSSSDLTKIRTEVRNEIRELQNNLERELLTKREAERLIERLDKIEFRLENDLREIIFALKQIQENIPMVEQRR